MPRTKDTLRWAGLASCLVSTAVAADEAQDWLAKMNEASREQSFRGAFVYERTGSFTTHNIWRSVNGDVVTERLVQSDGAMQEWLRRSGRLICSSGSDVGASSHQASQPVDRIQGLDDVYSSQLLGTTRVASRPVTVISLRPRDAHRYGYEFFLDSETGLLLKSLMIGDQGSLLERFQFAAIELGDVPPEALEPSAACQDIPASNAASVTASDNWLPAWVPQGFTLQSESSDQVAGSSSPVLSRTYTDGLTRFSLFVEPLDASQQAENVRAQLGPTVAVSRKLSTTDGTILATLVGEIPVATAEQIVASLAPATPGTAQ